jgi:hypothetical protein
LTAQIAKVRTEATGLQTEFITLGSSFDSYAKQIRASFTDSIQRALSDTILHVKSANEALKELFNSFKTQLVSTFTKNLASSLTSGLAQLTGEKTNADGSKSGGIFGTLGGLLGDKNKADGSSKSKALWVQSVNAVGTASSDVTGLLGKTGSSVAGGASSLFSSLKGLFHAAGGLITGPGSGTSDSIPAMLSDGEYITPADKTRRFLPLLEAIRHGRLDGFANGGLVGLQSIAMPRGFSEGGLISDAGQLAPAGGSLMVQLDPAHLNLTMRDWLEREVATQLSRR